MKRETDKGFIATWRTVRPRDAEFFGRQRWLGKKKGEKPDKWHRKPFGFLRSRSGRRFFVALGYYIEFPRTGRIALQFNDAFHNHPHNFLRLVVHGGQAFALAMRGLSDSVEVREIIWTMSSDKLEERTPTAADAFELFSISIDDSRTTIQPSECGGPQGGPGVVKANRE